MAKILFKGKLWILLMPLINVINFEIERRTFRSAFLTYEIEQFPNIHGLYNDYQLPVHAMWAFFYEDIPRILTLHLYVICRLKVQTVPGLWWFDLKFFDFTVVRKQYAFGRNKIQILNFDLFSH